MKGFSAQRRLALSLLPQMNPLQGDNYVSMHTRTHTQNTHTHQLRHGKSGKQKRGPV